MTKHSEDLAEAKGQPELQEVSQPLGPQMRLHQWVNVQDPCDLVMLFADPWSSACVPDSSGTKVVLGCLYVSQHTELGFCVFQLFRKVGVCC